MDTPRCRLSINIPTYNRVRYLGHILDLLAPQLTPEVELNVIDNCSTDGTWDLLQKRLPAEHRFRQEKNLGVDGNVVTCLNFGRGEYIWLLGDDDVPKPDCVALLLEAIDTHNRAPLIFLRTHWVSDPDFYASNPVGDPKWRSVDPNTFMADVSTFFTALSSVVVRRGAVDDAFIRSQVGDVLTPAAAVLYTAFLEGRAVVSGAPMLICRSAHVDSYDGVTVFTRNLARLFSLFEPRGLDRSVINRVLTDTLTGVVPFIIRIQPFSFKGLRLLLGYCFKYPSVTPKLLRAFWTKIVASGRKSGLERVASGARRLSNKFVRAGYRRVKRGLDKGAQLEFCRAADHVGANCFVAHPVYVQGGGLTVGDSFRAGPGLRLEMVREHLEYRFDPRLQIADYVTLGANVTLRVLTNLTIQSRVHVEDGAYLSDVYLREDPTYLAACPPHYRQPLSRGPITVGENVLIKERAFISGGVTIGANAVIGRGAVVTRDVASNEIVPDWMGPTGPQGASEPRSR